MLRDLLLAEAEKASGVVVEDVALLLVAQERRFLDNRDCRFDDAGPIHLVRTEHHPLAESGVDELPDLLIEIGSRVEPLDPLHFEIGVVGGDGRTLRHKVGTDRRLDRYTIPFDVAPAEVVLDPGAGLLFEPGRSLGPVGLVRTNRLPLPDPPDLPDLPDLTGHALVIVLRAELF
jgi:hypothetical protein